MEDIKCAITGKVIKINAAYRVADIGDNLFRYILEKHPHLTKEMFIEIDELNKLRKEYIEEIIKSEIGELDYIDKEVLKAFSTNKLLSENIEDTIDEEYTISQKLADHIAEFGGSWTFIISFFLFIFIWILINLFVFMNKGYDPYPFILLNLILSCLASIQAPIIMMSQNRKEEKDRKRSEYDYKVNLKAELEIRLLHEKMDHLMINQNKRLLEIQEIQAEYLKDILRSINQKS
jgi:uncharacterized membrane protein